VSKKGKGENLEMLRFGVVGMGLEHHLYNAKTKTETRKDIDTRKTKCVKRTLTHTRMWYGDDVY
jgi:hypothetical protein